MHISNPAVSSVAQEADVIARLLALQGASVLELGCGKAEKTYHIAQKAASILALEVDETQLAILKAGTHSANIRFEHGGAEKIPASNASFDLVLMFKSLHHVPAELMDDAFSEIHRVLKPGGMAYISEPVFAGEFNEILRLFHDEQLVREQAFAAVKRAIASDKFSLVEQAFFLQPSHFENFAQLDKQVIQVTHTDHRLSSERLNEVRSRFEQFMTPEGAHFKTPIRVDLLQKAS